MHTIPNPPTSASAFSLCPLISHAALCRATRAKDAAFTTIHHRTICLRYHINSHNRGRSMSHSSGFPLFKSNNDFTIHMARSLHANSISIYSYPNYTTTTTHATRWTVQRAHSARCKMSLSRRHIYCVNPVIHIFLCPPTVQPPVYPPCFQSGVVYTTSAGATEEVGSAPFSQSY